MPLEYSFTCPLPRGLHARPASALEEVARAFPTSITLLNQRTGRRVDAKSVLGLLSLDIRPGDRCLLTVSGPDQRPALEALMRFIERELPGLDREPPAQQTPSVEQALPPLLRKLAPAFLRAQPVVPGIGCGEVVRLEAGAGIPDTIPRTGGEADVQLSLLHVGLEQLEHRLGQQQVRARQAVARGLLGAHRSVARDPAFRHFLERAVGERGCTAAGAIVEAEAHYGTLLEQTGSSLLAERVWDVRDVCRQLAVAIYGPSADQAPFDLPEEAICAADILTPSHFLALDRVRIRGLLLVRGGPTAHTVILARAAGIPTLVGVSGGDLDRLEGRRVVVDACRGIAIVSPSAGVLDFYQREERRLHDRQQRLRKGAARPVVTGDGRRLEIAANVGGAEEIAAAVESGADGIGLFRTEMLFAGRSGPPDEEEQFSHYRQAVEAAGGRRLIMRTLDAGADKPIPYLEGPRGRGPVTDRRGVALYRAFEEVFETQLRALLRASAFGPLQVMIPMVTGPEEVRWVREAIARAGGTCERAGHSFDTALPVGAMIEVPAAVQAIDRLAEQLDFFSIGTNDLLHALMATDRTESGRGGTLDPLEPAFLRLLQRTCEGVRAAGRWLGLCGEMGADVQALPLLVGLGLDEISVAPPHIGEVKAGVADLPVAECRRLLQQACRCADASRVRQLLADAAPRRPVPLIESELVIQVEGCDDQGAAIKTIADRLYVLGRTDFPDEIEEAVEARERIATTGFGHGFAIPHCRCDAVRASSLAVLKSRTPIPWPSLDGEGVRVVLFLAIRPSDAAAAEHLRLIAALARRLMHPQVRQALVEEEDPHRICRIIGEATAVSPSS